MTAYAQNAQDVLGHMVGRAQLPVRVSQLPDGRWAIFDDAGRWWVPYHHCEFDRRELCETVVAYINDTDRWRLVTASGFVAEAEDS